MLPILAGWLSLVLSVTSLSSFILRTIVLTAYCNSMFLVTFLTSAKANLLYLGEFVFVAKNHSKLN